MLIVCFHHLGEDLVPKVIYLCIEPNLHVAICRQITKSDL